MNTTKIADNTIVIDIHKSELESLGMDANSLCYSKPKERQFIKEIIENAKKTIGFETSNCRILIELYPKITGSCKLVVTKLSYENEYQYYMFENNYDLINAITNLKLNDFEIYTDDKTYIMKINTIQSRLNEYGTYINNPNFELFINEHYYKTSI